MPKPWKPCEPALQAHTDRSGYAVAYAATLGRMKTAYLIAETPEDAEDFEKALRKSGLFTIVVSDDGLRLDFKGEPDHVDKIIEALMTAERVTFYNPNGGGDA